MTARERAAWSELAMHLRTRSGGFGAIASQERESATRVEQRYPEEARIHLESAEHHDARAKAAAELATIAKQKADGSDV